MYKVNIYFDHKLLCLRNFWAFAWYLGTSVTHYSLMETLHVFINSVVAMFINPVTLSMVLFSGLGFLSTFDTDREVSSTYNSWNSIDHPIWKIIFLLY